MEEKEIFERISSDPDILHGKPGIKGTRIPVYLIVSLVAEDETWRISSKVSHLLLRKTSRLPAAGSKIA